MLNNTEHKNQNGTACTVSNSTADRNSAKVAERRLQRKFRQQHNTVSMSSGWRVTLW